MPDPMTDGQSHSTIIPTIGPTETWQIAVALSRLSDYTTRPDECYFAINSGFSDFDSSGAVNFAVSGRNYYLYRGAVKDLSSIADSPASDAYASEKMSGWQLPVPALVWPADRAWFVARDLDSHFATIAAATSAVDAVLDDTRIDAVADSHQDQKLNYYWT
ncbi:hypothetical protein L5G32_18495 [Gordonia sp. HY002]|uniref:hypothetical protein n=1 Tax=Gordonia zhenghanii TaxID=2911516 RepID=UPI001EF03D88|nr:hypothetical protein [Gordonia zhenghanii]MCF8572253.1 hypothetical protein [Gordonia zhenghanii]MCF8607578.1 hypothetical protein [Gordonia zhenghanii]